jgi:hypothetical protein
VDNDVIPKRAQQLNIHLFISRKKNVTRFWFVCVFFGYACDFVGLAYQGQDIMFRFIIEYSSLMDLGP